VRNIASILDSDIFEALSLWNGATCR